MNIIKLYILLFTTVTYAQFTAIPDINFETFLEQNNMGDGTNGNGLVLTANIENVTSLNIPQTSTVTDLTGIEDFISLEFLNFSYHLVSSVDLSNNLNLTRLACIGNTLSSLDLSNNILLEELACQENVLQTLTINSINLTFLECFNNSLETIDISNCINLRSLNCHRNSLMAIDVSNNPNLEFFDCARNNILSIDITNNTSLLYFLAPNNSELVDLEMRNGNNASLKAVNISGTDNLTCALVDDASASYLQNWSKDDFTNFVNNEAECAALGLQSFTKNSIEVYPNPTTSYLHINSKDDVINSVVIYNMNGTIVNSVQENVQKIDMSNLPDGFFILNIETETNNFVQKIIKQ